ncbi:hypothetical protein HPP92_015051 [Vanilla planifolia]|uniref:Uncharacterized protein n=1 Tax=Vanilla planifolia TaxID=51239 RepID=A0A835QS64_VANPL|nr:hypothetical protein HPP92_015051 [Vanilla planifolia]
MTYLIWQWLWFCQKVEQKKEKPAWLVARFCGRNCIIVRVYESVSDLPFVEWIVMAALSFELYCDMNVHSSIVTYSDPAQMKAVKALHVATAPPNVVCRKRSKNRVLEFIKACIQQEKAGVYMSVVVLN